MTELDDFRYPIGRFSRPANNDAATRAVHIEAIRALPGQLRAAVSGLNDAQLDEKFRDQAVLALPSATVESLIVQCRTLDTLPDVGALCRATVPAG